MTIEHLFWLAGWMYAMGLCEPAKEGVVNMIKDLIALALLLAVWPMFVGYIHRHTILNS